jgi:predicted short-subunit dehydrogenase-like oxidoreductase (DUF2520 family)
LDLEKDRDGTMQKPTIAIIGPGRAGSALGRALHTAGYTIAAIGGRNPDNVRNLADELGARACQSPAGAIDLADLTILAVPDDVILPLATDMVDSLCSAAGKAAVHLSGAQDRAALRPLAQQGSLRTGVFHPLQTFRRGPEAVGNVAGTYFGIDADAPLRDQLMQLARDLHGHPFDLAGVDRALYHAAAVFAANYPITLLAEAIALATAAGLDAQTAGPGMTALLAGAVGNLRELAPADAITGPASRGDQGTIQRHLDALRNDPELRRLYELLAERTKHFAPNKEAAA